MDREQLEKLLEAANLLTLLAGHMAEIEELTKQIEEQERELCARRVEKLCGSNAANDIRARAKYERKTKGENWCSSQ